MPVCRKPFLLPGSFLFLKELAKLFHVKQFWGETKMQQFLSFFCESRKCQKKAAPIGAAFLETMTIISASAFSWFPQNLQPQFC
ncbi:MAG: hypothetical protein L0Z48_04470, partial [candidate division Zixibacteria bacterium]|nr:hypothetical protein [candidate division Zixibacteria bacterium]